jgi:hypothetical protein
MAKRNKTTGRGRWAREWDNAYGLLPRRKRANDDADRVAIAKREVADNLAAGGAAALGDFNMQTDVIKSMTDRLSEIRNACPDLTEGAAMLKLAESRNPEDQQLWRQYKMCAPTGAVAKEDIDVAKAIKEMAERCSQLMAADAGIRSRESAIAKVATSTDPDDLRLWARYRAAGQVAPVAALPASSPAPVGKGQESIVFDNLCRAIRDSFPGISSAQVRQWAQAVMAGNPPKEMLTVRTHAA